MPISFGNKGLQFIHLSSILFENEVINCFLEGLREDEITSIVYSLFNTIRNKIFNYKNT